MFVRHLRKGLDGDMRERILLALCGMSPAVITETVYSLAGVGRCPSKVVVITTTEGKRALGAELFDGGVWESLCGMLGEDIDFGLSSYHVRLIPKSDSGGDAEDILTTSDNERAADFILDILREFTENPDTELVFSMAGGRKTMSVLAALSMSLLGREQDILCHVLVNPPFDNPSLAPKFYFPGKTACVHMLPGGRKWRAKDARITLCEIPFVRLRYLFQHEFSRLPGSFNGTVSLANFRLNERLPAPELKIVPERMQIWLGNVSLPLNCQEFVMYWMLAERCRNGLPQIYGQSVLREEFTGFVGDIGASAMPEILHHKTRLLNKSDDDVRKILSSISQKIRRCLGISQGRDACMPSAGRGVYSISLPPENIVIL